MVAINFIVQFHTEYSVNYCNFSFGIGISPTATKIFMQKQSSTYVVVDRSLKSIF